MLQEGILCSKDEFKDREGFLGEGGRKETKKTTTTSWFNDKKEEVTFLERTSLDGGGFGENKGVGAHQGALARPGLFLHLSHFAG